MKKRNVRFNGIFTWVLNGAPKRFALHVDHTDITPIYDGGRS